MKPHILVSRCLLGDAVRYDGKSKPAPAVAGLDGRAQLIAVCPEVEAGLGVPRPPIDRVRQANGLRVIDRAAGRDATDALDAVAAHRLATRPHGFVGKARSPSCGVGDAACYTPAGDALAPADGQFVEQLRRRWPDVPICTDETLDVPFLVEAALQAADDGSPFALLDFHGRFGQEWSAGAAAVTRERLAAYAHGGARAAYSLLLGAVAGEALAPEGRCWSASCLGGG
ncbi:MAG: 2-thiouracil desulfurase family protein [bacterium]